MNYEFSCKGITYNHLIIENPKEKGFFKHAHNLYEIIYFLNGDADYVIENRRYSLKRGDVLLIKPRDYHYLSLRSDSPYERINIGFDKWFVKNCPLDDVFAKCELLRLDDTTFFDEWYHRMDDYISNFAHSQLESLSSLLTSELIFLLSKVESDRVESDNNLSPLVSNAISLIGNNPENGITIESLAKTLFVSKSFFQHTFKNELGISPKRFIQNKRLLSAQNLLRIGDKPTRVCEKVGYMDYSTFYRAYTKFFGESPEQTSIKAKK